MNNHHNTPPVVYRDTIFPVKTAHFLLPGPAGQLEIRTETPTISVKNSLAVICHPHPLMGGTMDNKVVYTIARGFKDIGSPIIRFNFRGVGASEGHYDHGKGELDDLITILTWAQQVCPDHTIYLAGFSFGSFIAACAAQSWPIAHLILVAPPVERFNFQALPLFNCPWSVIQGDQDEVVRPTAVFDWMDRLSPSGDLHCLPGAGHFFHGQLITLRETLIGILNRT